MDERVFIEICKEKVAEYNNEKNIERIEPQDVYVVWSCKTLQNNKALLSTNVPDGRYYECTFNGDKKEIYFDSYVKESNKCIPLG